RDAARQRWEQDPGSNIALAQAQLANSSEALKKVSDDLTKNAEAIQNARFKQAGGGEQSGTITALSDMRTSLAEGLRCDGVGGVVLPRGMLRTLSIDEIHRRINEANRANPDVGWSESESRVAENRNVVLQAVIEARLTATSPELDTMLDADIWRMSEYDFLA